MVIFDENQDENQDVSDLSKYEFHCSIYVKIIMFLVIWHHFDNFYVIKWSKNPLPSLCVMSSKKLHHVSYKITTLLKNAFGLVNLIDILYILRI